MRFRRRRSSVLPRPDWGSLPRSVRVPLGRGPLPSLRGEAWFRSGPRRWTVERVTDAGVRSRRLAAAGLAGFELLLLVTALATPAFKVRHVEVTGTHRLTAAQVVAAAGLQAPGSVFAVDPSRIRQRLEASTWIRYSTVSTSLPDRVTVRVEEWQPVATFHAAGGPRYFLSDQAVALGPVGDGDGRDGLVDIEGAPNAEPRAGRRALDPQLLTALVNTQRALPRLIGQEVASFAIDGCGNVTLLAVKGWRAQFGRLLTPEEFATLHDKVAALKAVARDVDYNSPDLDSVNVMNPAAVAVRTKSRPAPSSAPSSTAPSAAPGQARPVRVAAPAAAPQPTVQVAPCK